jgi:RNA-directed DNA polymerase
VTVERHLRRVLGLWMAEMGNLLSRISRELFIPLDDLMYLARSAPHRYKVYEIKKKQPGKTRTIAQPAREVKKLQYWVISAILKQFPIHSAALAYRKGKSILNNAKPHVRKKFLLKLDFKDFFHSIKASDFRQLLEQTAPTLIDPADLDYVCRILFWRDKFSGELILSIGAPSSPVLSNIVMYEFDRVVEAYCRSVGVTYTRYADDLTFSTNKRQILTGVATEIDRICRELPFPRLRLNTEKTVHASKATLRRVTGLVLSNEGKVSIGHERKRDIHVAVHHFKVGKLNADKTSALAGMLAFVNSVEPSFLQVLTKRYGKSVIKRLSQGNNS